MTIEKIVAIYNLVTKSTQTGPVRDLAAAKQWFKLASMVVVVTTALPSGSGLSSGRISWTSPYTEYIQSNLDLVGRSNQVDQF